MSYTVCHVIYCMSCHILYVLLYTLCPVIYSMSCHIRYVLLYTLCPVIYAMSCHIFHVMSYTECPVIYCMSCHILYVLSYTLCHVIHYISCHIRYVMSYTLCPVIYAMSCHILYVLSCKLTNSIRSLPHNLRSTPLFSRTFIDVFLVYGFILVLSCSRPVHIFYSQTRVLHKDMLYCPHFHLSISSDSYLCYRNQVTSTILLTCQLE